MTQAKGKRRGQGEDSIYWDSSKNRYVGAVSLGFSPSGARIRRKVTGRTKAEVRDKLRELHLQVEIGLRPRRRYTVNDALDDWLAHGLDGLSPRTVRQMHAIVKSALAQAVKWELLVRNPAAAVRGPKVGRAAMQTYDLAQTAELIELARGRRIFIPILLAVHGGLRRGEIAALRWRHLDLSGAQLAVVQSAEQTTTGVRYKEPKSGRGRTIALSVTLLTELRAHRVRQARELLQIGKHLSDDDFVVTQADGSSLRPHSLGQEWVRFLARNGTALPRIRFHDLRHAHATHLLSSGVHPKVASERLGHSKVGITLDLYSHVLPNMQADAAAIVDDALKAVLNKRQSKG